MNAPASARAVRPRGRRRSQLSDEVAQHLREAIMTGTLRPGTFIRLDETAAQLGVSITPVREALLTARLQHPAIVPVYQAGRWPSGEPFYAMKLVSGRPLDRAIAEAHRSRVEAHGLNEARAYDAEVRAIGVRAERGEVEACLPRRRPHGPRGRRVLAFDAPLSERVHLAAK